MAQSIPASANNHCSKPGAPKSQNSYGVRWALTGDHLCHHEACVETKWSTDVQWRALRLRDGIKCKDVPASHTIAIVAAIVQWCWRLHPAIYTEMTCLVCLGLHLIIELTLAFEVH